MEPIHYGAKVQYSQPIDHTPISDEQHKFIQQVTGKFLFYARAVDPTMLHALNCIACGGATQANLEATQYFLNYAACNPDAQIIYRKSDMILKGIMMQHILLHQKPGADSVVTSSSGINNEHNSMDHY